MKKIEIVPGVKALIFDLDGTLSNSLPVHLRTWQMVGERFGFEFDPAIILELTGRPTIEFARRVIERYGVKETPENIVKMKQEAFWDCAHLLQPVDEVVSVVKENAGKRPMAVGTGASRRSAEVQLESLGLTSYFTAIVSADDVTSHKPEPTTFLECARLMGVEPSSCQVFEDGELGIEAAKRAGMHVTDVREYISYGEWALS